MGSTGPAIEDLIAAAIGTSSTSAAVEALLTRLYPRLLGFAIRLCSERDLADEICQETMVRVITKLRGFRPAEGRVARSFDAWVFTIAANVYRDMLRKLSRVVPVDDVPCGSEHLMPNVTASSPSEDIALERMSDQSVADALSVLPYEQRTAFIMRAFYDFSYREIGEACGCPEGTAKSRMHNAVRALRDEFQKRRML